MFKSFLHWNRPKEGPLGWSRAGVLVLWGEIETPRLFQPGEKVTVGDLRATPIAVGRSARTQNQAPRSSGWLEDNRPYTWIKQGKFRDVFFSLLDSQIMGEIVQAGCMVSVLIFFQDLTGHNLRHPYFTSDLVVLWAAYWIKPSQGPALYIILYL